MASASVETVRLQDREAASEESEGRTRSIWRIGLRLLQVAGEMLTRLLAVTFFVHAVIYLSPGRKAYRPAFSGMWEYVEGLVRHYLSWLFSLLHGDLGMAPRGEAVGELLMQHLPRTLGLVAGALGMSSLLAVVLVWLAVTWRDHPAMRVIAQGVRFVSGMPVLILCLLVSWATGHFRGFTLWMLLILAIGDSTLGDYFTVLREEIGRILSQDYVGAAKGRGCSVLRHARREMSMTVLGIVVSRVPVLIGGVIILEEAFSYFGLGHDIVEATNSQSIDLQMGVALFIAVLVIGTSSIGEALHGMLDPRVSARL